MGVFGMLSCNLFALCFNPEFYLPYERYPTNVGLQFHLTWNGSHLISYRN